LDSTAHLMEFTVQLVHGGAKMVDNIKKQKQTDRSIHDNRDVEPLGFMNRSD